VIGNPIYQKGLLHTKAMQLVLVEDLQNLWIQAAAEDSLLEFLTSEASGISDIPEAEALMMQSLQDPSMCQTTRPSQSFLSSTSTHLSTSTHPSTYPSTSTHPSTSTYPSTLCFQRPQDAAVSWQINFERVLF